jgi:DNA-binding MarR family transcriptional regulator
MVKALCLYQATIVGRKSTPMTDHTEAIGRELVALIKGTKDLHHVVTTVDGGRVLDPPAFVVLSRLQERGPLRLSSLAGSLYLDLSTVSRQVQELEQAGWVVRERDPRDGRASLIRLTPDGERVLEVARTQRGAVLRRLLTGWTDDERRRLAAELARFNQAVADYRIDARQENAS